MQDGRSERLTQAIAQSLCRHRQRHLSTHELAQRLAAKGFTETETRETIEWLIAEGYLGRV